MYPIIDDTAPSPPQDTLARSASSHAAGGGSERSGDNDDGCVALGTSRIKFPPPLTWDDAPAHQERRRERYRRRAASSELLIRSERLALGHEPVAKHIVDTSTGELRKPRAGEYGWVRPPRPARCSWRVSSGVGVHGMADGGGTAHFSGTERCGSIWACPVCASVIRPQRAAEIGHAVTEHQKAGGQLLFMTLTLRHHKGQDLALTLDTVLTGWQRLLGGKPWQKQKARYGIEGYIRSVEVTWGASAGWHPHIHAIFFLAEPLSETQIQAFGDWVHSKWSEYAYKQTGLMPSRQHGVDVQKVDESGQVIAQYLGKLQDDKSDPKRWDVGAELARGDVKDGHAENLVPFELLDDFRGEEWQDKDKIRRLWFQYFEATRGRRAITWSRGLKDRYGVNELTDEEIIEETEAQELRYIAPGAVYDGVRRGAPELLAVVLEAAEAGDWEKVIQILPGGLLAPDEPPPD